MNCPNHGGFCVRPECELHRKCQYRRPKPGESLITARPKGSPYIAPGSAAGDIGCYRVAPVLGTS